MGNGCYNVLQAAIHLKKAKFRSEGWGAPHAAGRHELPTHTALLDPVRFQNTLYRSPIVPCGQPGHHAFLHRSLQFSVVLQLPVALQFHFLAFPRSYPRSFQRNFLSSKNHITRLLSPAHTAGGRIRPMRWSYSARDFVVQDGAPEGGPPTPPTKGLRRGKFVSQDCPYFKIDVEFEPVARPDIGYGPLGFSPEDNRDVILKVSKPYVQFATTN
jgi:hypothetical protein